MQSPSTTAKFLKVTHVLFIKGGFLEGKKVTVSCNTIFSRRLCFPRQLLMDPMGRGRDLGVPEVIPPEITGNLSQDPGTLRHGRKTDPAF